jgi:phage terminase large subunit-like protein
MAVETYKDVINGKILTKSERRDLYSYVGAIIDNLSPVAMQELLSGYGNDLDQLFISMLQETHRIIHVNTTTIDPESVDYLPNLEKVMDETMKVQSYNYFKSTMLPNFNMNWRNIEWGNLVQMYPWSSFQCQRGSGKSFEWCGAFPLWRAYGYHRLGFMEQPTRENNNRKETVIITNESSLGIRHLEKIVEEIRVNDFLHDILLPHNANDLGKEQIRTKNGASIILRSKGSSAIRGLHVGTVVVDDFLDKSCLYSKDQRDKFEEVFYGEIISIVEPNGYLVVSGTPFFESDMYARIKKDPNFKTFIYPGIFPDGRILAPDRYTYEKLMELKESLGTIVFTREHLVKPVSDYSSLFPWEYLNRSKVGMENISLVQNIDSFPIKMERVALGCDFAISGAVSADYSVFSVWGRGVDKKYYLIHVFRKKGMPHGEQVSEIVSLNNRFQPNEIIAEGNGFQSVMIELVKERGVANIKSFITESNLKKDLYEGLPSLSAMFERGEIRIPYGDENSKNTFQWLCGEFNSVTFHEDSGKLESSSDHDDGAMSTFFAVTDLRESKSTFKVHYM